MFRGHISEFLEAFPQMLSGVKTFLVDNRGISLAEGNDSNISMLSAISVDLFLLSCVSA